MRPALIFTMFAAGCATTPNFDRQRSEVLGRVEVRCWIQGLASARTKYPREMAELDAQLTQEGANCSPENRDLGRRMVLDQSARESAAVAAAEAKAQQQREAVAGGALRVLEAIAIIGGAAAAAQAMAPPPPRPVICNTSRNGTMYSTVCY